jgi:hypothetical protein
MPPFLKEITLVSGYDRDAEARQTQGDETDSRLAVVFDSYHPTSPDAEFDFDLYKLLIVPAVAALQGDRERVTFDGNAVCPSLAAGVMHIEAIPHEDREPPRLVEVIVGERRIAVVELEDWVYHGGPTTYHDSYTFVVYGEETYVRRFGQKCRSVAADLGLKIVDVMGDHFKPR